MQSCAAIENVSCCNSNFECVCKNAYTNKCKAAYPDETPSAICNFGPVLISLASHYHNIALLCCSNGPPDGGVPVLTHIPPPSAPNITFNIVTQQQGSHAHLCESLMVVNNKHKMQAQGNIYMSCKLMTCRWALTAAVDPHTMMQCRLQSADLMT